MGSGYTSTQLNNTDFHEVFRLTKMNFEMAFVGSESCSDWFEHVKQKLNATNSVSDYILSEEELEKYTLPESQKELKFYNFHEGK